MSTSLKSLYKSYSMLIVCLLIGLILYSRFLFFGHISWDDPEMVFKNKAVHNFDVKAFFSNHYVGNYIPFTMLFHSIAWQLFGANDWGHHLLNIVLHLLNGILVYKIGKLLFQQELVALVGTLVFLVHPMQLESVGWIAELKNVLSLGFYLTSFLFFIRYSQTKKWASCFFAFLFFTMACLSKSSAVVLPLIFMLTDFFLHKKFRPSTAFVLLPFLIVSAILGYINIQTQTADLFINHSHEFPYYQRVALAGFALANYSLLFLFPIQLSAIYPYPVPNLATLTFGFFVLTALSLGMYLLFKRKRFDWIFLIVFILINFSLVLQFLPFGEVLVADRYMYIPVIGFAWMLGLLVQNIKLSSTLVLSCLMCVYGLLCLSSGSRWSSAITLYEDIVKKYPKQFVALNSAGVECMFLNKDSKALEYLNRATQVAPNNYKGFYNRALLYIKNNKPREAIQSLNYCLTLYPYYKAYTARASAYYKLGDFSKAIGDANLSLQHEKNNYRAHFVLGNCYNDMNRLQDALREYNSALSLNNEDPDCFFKRAIVYGKNQDFKSSLNDLNICLALKPDYYEAFYWKGVAKLNLRESACEDFKTAALHNFEPAVVAYNKYCR